MARISIPRSVFEKIKAVAREEVYDAIFRHSGIDASDEELDGWFHSRDSKLLGVTVIEDDSVSADEKQRAAFKQFSPIDSLSV